MDKPERELRWIDAGLRGDIGLNVWLEKDELLVYMGQAGCRDKNGALLKPGRIRVKLTPNPFENAEFKQELKLREGYVLATAKQSDGNDVSIKRYGLRYTVP